MIQLIYISSATRFPSEEDLKQLLEIAREKNKTNHITGMLLYGNATYMQVIEGEKKYIHELFEKICKDTRHTGIVKLVEKEIEERNFPNWSMGFKHLDNSSILQEEGFIDIFGGNFDKSAIVNNKSSSTALMMHFAKNF